MSEFELRWLVDLYVDACIKEYNASTYNIICKSITDKKEQRWGDIVYNLRMKTNFEGSGT